MIGIRDFCKGLLVGSAALFFLAAPAGAADGAALYKTNCASCHGDSGKGDGPAGQYLNPRPADLGEVVKTVKEEEIFKAIKEGGQAVGKSPLMAPFGATLSDEEIKAIMAYIKTFAK